MHSSGDQQRVRVRQLESRSHSSHTATAAVRQMAAEGCTGSARGQCLDSVGSAAVLTCVSSICTSRSSLLVMSLGCSRRVKSTPLTCKCTTWHMHRRQHALQPPVSTLAAHWQSIANCWHWQHTINCWDIDTAHGTIPPTGSPHCILCAHKESTVTTQTTVSGSAHSTRHPHGQWVRSLGLCWFPIPRECS